MNKKLFSLIMLVSLLAFGLIIVGCDTGGGGGDYVPPAKGEYHLKWGTTSTNRVAVLEVIKDQGWTVTDSSTDWVLGTGQVAIDAYNWCNKDNNVIWSDGGDFDGTFEQCVNFTKDSVGAPQGLKAAATKHKSDAPLACIYDYNNQFAVLCYITKN